MYLIDKLAADMMSAAGDGTPFMLTEPFPNFSELRDVSYRLALDIGGSTLRLGSVDLNRLECREILRESIPEEVKNSNLLVWVGKLLSDTMDSKSEKLWVSWSFPLKDGVVQPMAKGYNGYEGLKAAECLNEAFQRYGLGPVEAVLNDAVAVLVAGSVADPDCCISLVWGTGINIAVMSSQDTVKNLEAGMIGLEHYGKGLFTDQLETEVEEQGPKMHFERAVGGKYLGQHLARLSNTAPDSVDFYSALRHLRHPQNPQALVIMEMCTFRVAIVLLAAIKALLPASNHVKVAINGGVIQEPQILESLTKQLEKLAPGKKITFFPQLPEVGAAIVLGRTE